VAGGASKLTFDELSYQAVAGNASWTASDFEQAADRYDIEFSRGVRDVVVDTLEIEASSSQRLLATVLFTDIVGSTERVRAVGDQRWRELLDRHDQAAHRLVEDNVGRLRPQESGRRAWEDRGDQYSGGAGDGPAGDAAAGFPARTRSCGRSRRRLPASSVRASRVGAPPTRRSTVERARNPAPWLPLRQRPPVKPPVRFSRRRRPDIVHRQACAVPYHTFPLRR